MKPGKTIVVLGAPSAIAEATARLYAAEGAAIALAGRDRDRLEALAADLRVRGARQVRVHAHDLAEMRRSPNASETSWRTSAGSTRSISIMASWATSASPSATPRRPNASC